MGIASGGFAEYSGETAHLAIGKGATKTVALPNKQTSGLRAPLGAAFPSGKAKRAGERERGSGRGGVGRWECGGGCGGQGGGQGGGGRGGGGVGNNCGEGGACSHNLYTFRQVGQARQVAEIT